MTKNWKTARRWLLAALGVCVIALFGVYAVDAYVKLKMRQDEPLDREGFLPPKDAEEAEKMMMKEVEAGRSNHEPGTFGLVFRGDEGDVCAWRCLDTAVAAGMDVYLFTPDGTSCKTKTLDPVLWKSEAFMLPATPLEKKSECGESADFALAIYASEKPKFEWIDMHRQASADPKEIAAFNKDRQLRDRLIEGSSKAEGTLALTDVILPLPPFVAVVPTPEGPVTLRTARWTEKREDGSLDEPRTGPTEYSLSNVKPKPIAENGLFCSEVPHAFKLNDETYIFQREWGCDSGLSCHGVFHWEHDHFQLSYGNCNFST